MKRASSLPRRLLVLAVGLLTGVLALPAAASADSPTSVGQPFYADSSSPFDACPHGVTKGMLNWRTSGDWTMAVRVSGSLIDQPTSSNTSALCANDGYDSTAKFTLFYDNREVDRASVKVDNGVAAFDFTLKGVPSSDSAVIQPTLVVQVCRDPVLTNPISYCGKPVTYVPCNVCTGTDQSPSYDAKLD